MSGWEIALLVGLCVLFVAAVAVIIYNKARGKSGCDCCDCGKSGKNDSPDGSKPRCDGHCAMCMGLQTRDDVERKGENK
ncbi:MAG: hypothetical protein K2L54_04900 [Clostridiales bacterium]|nr:hypothetical protein [Clostridiales bacterium]